MWWAALIPIAMELLGQMSKQGKGGQGGGAPMALPQVPPFNPQPMMTGDSRERDMTASALRGNMPNVDFPDGPSAGGPSPELMAQIMRRSGAGGGDMGW